MTANRLHPDDRALVEIYFDGKKVTDYESSGFHTVEQAMETAFNNSSFGFRFQAV